MSVNQNRSQIGRRVGATTDQGMALHPLGPARRPCKESHHVEFESEANQCRAGLHPVG
jgi:hypothetical protein